MKAGWFKNWDEDQKASAVRIFGLIVAALTIFTFISSLSYLIHWKEDMSLLSEANPMDKAVHVNNMAGKLGYKFGYLLICKWFGLGSFAFLVILAATSLRLLFDKWHHSLLKTLILVLLGAAISSVALAFIAGYTRLQYIFGAGLGGECGNFVTDWAINLFGPVLTGTFIIILILCYLFFCSRKFTRWFSSLGTKNDTPEPCRKKRCRKEKEKEEKEDEGERIVDPDDFFGQEAADTAPAGELASVEAALETGSTADQEGLEVFTDDSLDAKVKEPLPPINNRLDPPDGLPSFQNPPISILNGHSSERRVVPQEELMRNNNRIRAALSNYGIQINDVKAIVGPTVTLYKVYPAAGVKISEIRKLQDDIAMSLNAKGVRVDVLNDSVGIEVANDYASIVPLKSLLNDESFRESKAELPVAIGYTITQKVKVIDLADAPHLLIAGATKQGKSVGLNVIVSSLIYSKHPSELKFVFIDPKMVEFSTYNKLLHHYLAVLPSDSEDEEIKKAIVKTSKDAEKILRSLCIEMDERYNLFSEGGVNNVKLYNDKFKDRKLNPQKGHRFMPYIVTVVDEYADLTMTVGASPEARAASRSITNSIVRLAQKGRAAGIHVILATQRPSVDVISGVIKSNFPMRIAFRVASRIDSMTILDAPGAEKLIGRGDMLYSAGIDTERIQCGYVSMDEIESITGFVGKQIGYGKSYSLPYYLPLPSENGGAEGGSLDIDEFDERFVEAAKLVVTTQRGSTSDLQRKLAMGYSKAGRVMDQLCAAGIVGPQDGSKPREVKVATLEELQEILNGLKR